jgi:hypothetical protein
MSLPYIPIKMSPTEDWPLEVNFGVGDWGTLFDADPINEAACTVTNWADGPVPAGLTAGAPAVSGKVVQVRLTPSAAGDYQIKVKAVSTANFYDAEEFFLVRVAVPTVPS